MTLVGGPAKPALRLLERCFDDPDRGASWDQMRTLCDEFLPDVFPWQIIGPGHLHRLGGLPRGGTSLAGGYAELALTPTTLGLTDPVAFAQVRAAAMSQLQPCLLSEDHVAQERARRWQR